MHIYIKHKIYIHIYIYTQTMASLATNSTLAKRQRMSLKPSTIEG